MASYPVKRFEEFIDRLASGKTVRIEYDQNEINLFPKEIDVQDLRSMAEFLEFEANKFERLRFSVDGMEILFDNDTSIKEIIEYWKTQPEEDYDEALASV
tara:strand:+ start:301 stop:600 length:300 start_codon:yes stop_codon:yes gene_type:complete